MTGRSTLLIKVLQGVGGWGYYVRLVDPEGQLLWKTENPPRSPNGKQKHHDNWRYPENPSQANSRGILGKG